MDGSLERSHRRFIGRLFSALSNSLASRALWHCVRLQITTPRAAERSDGNQCAFLKLKPHPEARLGLTRRPVLLLVSGVGAICHKADFHLCVTPQTFNRLIHVSWKDTEFRTHTKPTSRQQLTLARRIFKCRSRHPSIFSASAAPATNIPRSQPSPKPRPNGA
jgi:hypothetical protein